MVFLNRHVFGHFCTPVTNPLFLSANTWVWPLTAKREVAELEIIYACIELVVRFRWRRYKVLSFRFSLNSHEISFVSFILYTLLLCVSRLFFSCFDCLAGMLHFRDILAKQVAFQILCISQPCTRCVNYSTCSTKLIFLFRSALSTVNLTNSTLMQISTEKINNFIFVLLGVIF